MASYGACFPQTPPVLNATLPETRVLSHVRLAFFGLTRRTFRWTKPSIQRNVLGVLRALGITWQTFAHIYVNDGGQEAFNRSVVPLFRELDPAAVIKTSPVASFRASCGELVDYCKSSGDAWHNSFRSYDNHMAQLYSIQRVALEMAATAGPPEPDAVMFIRPDTIINCPLPETLFTSFEPGVMYVPLPGSINGSYINDRFAFGSPSVMHHWAHRLSYTSQTCHKRKVHAETNLQNLVKSKKMKVEFLQVQVIRVRKSGDIAAPDLWAVKRRVCKSNPIVPSFLAKHIDALDCGQGEEAKHCILRQIPAIFQGM